MGKNNILLLAGVLLTAVCTSCISDNQISGERTSLDTIRLDDAEKKNKIFYSDFLEAPQVIILETSPECIIKSVNSIELYKDKLFILDDGTQSLYVFNMNGKFVRRIGNRGNGNGEYKRLSDFSIDREHNIIYIMDEADETVLKYDLNTYKYISTFKIRTEKSGGFNILYYKGSFYVNNATLDDSSDNFELRQFDAKTGKQTGEYLNSKKYNNGWTFPLHLNNSLFYEKSGINPKYVGMFSNIIVSLTDDGPIGSYFVESSNFATEEDVKHITDQFTKYGGIYKFAELYKNKRIHQISSVFETKDILSFKYMEGDTRKYAVYDKDTRKVSITYLFINDYVCDEIHIPMDICYNGEEGVLCCLKPEFMQPFFKYVVKAGKLKKTLSKFNEISKLDEQTNPVIFYHQRKR